MRRFLHFCLTIVALTLYGEAGQEAAPRAGEQAGETWMGVFMNGIKVGYTLTRESVEERNGHSRIRSYSESKIRVSRLGGNPIEMVTIQESWLTPEEIPLETVLTTKMSETETVISAEIEPETITFRMAGEVVKEVPYQGRFYLGVPLEKIIEDHKLVSGNTLLFKILDPVAYALSECRVTVMDKEDILILGEKKRLWHVHSELASVVPVTVDEWIDEEGAVYKSIMQSGFISTVSLRMSPEKAVEISDESFDIAFSSVIPANIELEMPLRIQNMRLKLQGLPVERLKRLPLAEESQTLVEAAADHIVIETRSVIMREADGAALPVDVPELAPFLESTVFCQSGDQDIAAKAREIIGSERNSWRAAKKIAEWIASRMRPNYDVGFASAREILKNLEGDCSEHTVLCVALCRAVGIPARAAVGIMYAEGIFAYHMWPEVYVGKWVGLDAKWLARDEASGEYFTDATHIKFGHSDLGENMYQEMLRAISEIIGKLSLEILEYSHAPRTLEPPLLMGFGEIGPLPGDSWERQHAETAYSCSAEFCRARRDTVIS